jgi:hypothetical protein
MKDERSIFLNVFQLRTDGWLDIYHCKRRVPAMVGVFEVIGWPVEPSGDPALIEAFFVELKKQRPDLFKQATAGDFGLQLQTKSRALFADSKR